MTFAGIVFVLGIILILPLGVSSSFAENSWNIFMTPYDGIQKDELFSPFELPISSGDTVTWINQDSVTHKITSGIPAHLDFSGEFFETGVLSPGDSFSIPLEFPGFAGYYYFCEIHPWFTGKIFFEDRDGILHSTLDITYDVVNSESLQISGLVEPDLGNTSYEIQIYDSKNNLIFDKLSSFEPDASFELFIDISSSIWDHDENYLLKLVYSVPSESTELALNIPADNLNSELKSNALEFCNDSSSDFFYSDVLLPSWFSQSLCWFGTGLVVEKEISDSIHFFQKLSQT